MDQWDENPENFEENELVAEAFPAPPASWYADEEAEPEAPVIPELPKEAATPRRFCG